MKFHRLILPAGLLAVLLLGGCDREAPIRTYKAPKEPPAAAVAAKSGTGMPAAHGLRMLAALLPDGERVWAFKLMGPSEILAPHKDAFEDLVKSVRFAGEKIDWSAPGSWKQLPPSQFSYAAYQVSDNPPVKMTVSQVTLTGTMGKTLVDNVNRWQGQLGLSPIAEADLPKVGTPIKVADREAYLFDLGANSAAADQAEKPAPAAADAASKIPGIASMSLPEGWSVDATPRAMRAGTIVVTGADGQKAEIVVSTLGPAALNDIMSNVNRWRNQVKLPPTDDAKAHPAQEISFPQGPGATRDFEGPADAGASRTRQVVAYTQFPKGERIWFFRLVGPYDLVTKSKPAFDAFVRSVKFEER